MISALALSVVETGSIGRMPCRELWNGESIRNHSGIPLNEKTGWRDIEDQDHVGWRRDTGYGTQRYSRT